MEPLNVTQQEVTVKNENGLHLVPCSRIAELARSYETCEIHIRKTETEAETQVNAKTIFDLMTLGAQQGTRLILEARGEAASEVIDKMVHLFANNFEVEES